MADQVTPTPTPLTYIVQPLPTPDGKGLVLVTLYTVVGPITTFWDPAGAERFAGDVHHCATQARTGLVLPPSVNGSAPAWPATPGDDVLDITYDFDPDVGEVFCIGGPFDQQKVPQPRSEDVSGAEQVTIAGPDGHGGRVTATYVLREPLPGKKALVYAEPGPQIVDEELARIDREAAADDDLGEPYVLHAPPVSEGGGGTHLPCCGKALESGDVCARPGDPITCPGPQARTPLAVVRDEPDPT